MSKSFYKLDPGVLESFAVYVAKVTTKARLAQSNPPELSAKAAQVQALLTKSSSFGCQTDNVRQLCSILLEEELPVLGNDKLPVENSIIVITTDKDNMQTALNQPCFVYQIYNNCTAYIAHVNEKQRTGIGFASTRGTAWRYAKASEIEAFAENFHTDHLIQLLTTYPIGKLVGVK